MKRRDFVTSVLVAGLATPVIGDTKGGKDGGTETQEGHEGHGRHDDDDRLRTHQVNFGHWNVPMDRFAPKDPNDRTKNGHLLIPNKVRISVGDTVTFAISGFHNVLIYGPGTQPQDIDRTNLVPGSAPALINDPKNRVYRGLDPRTLTLASSVAGAPPISVQDRVESVGGFTTPGIYLAMCGVLAHFFDAATGTFLMFGFIDVRNDDN
jgi:plastocyanin